MVIILAVVLYIITDMRAHDSQQAQPVKANQYWVSSGRKIDKKNGKSNTIDEISTFFSIWYILCNKVSSNWTTFIVQLQLAEMSIIDQKLNQKLKFTFCNAKKFLSWREKEREFQGEYLLGSQHRALLLPQSWDGCGEIEESRRDGCGDRERQQDKIICPGKRRNVSCQQYRLHRFRIGKLFI